VAEIAVFYVAVFAVFYFTANRGLTLLKKLIYIILIALVLAAISSCALLQKPLDKRTGFSNYLKETENHIRSEDWVQAEFALREALAMGADEAILLSDRAFAGADTWATSFTLAQGIKKLGNFDLILCGRQAIDGDTAQVGPGIAEHLDLPQVTYLRKIISIDDTKAVVERAMEDGYQVVEVSLPAVLTAVKELNTPRYPSTYGIVDAFELKQVTVWGLEQLGVSADLVGLQASPTKVKKTFSPPGKGEIKFLEGTIKESVLGLITELQGKNVLQRG
jgi:electron transfer flavoprotein beta subunit